ncbi:putative Leucine-rich receptor-like kinase family protein [Melia azedarach]|uniref:Leucine-rich receptor-like kinase family protein n=1 Tax=Melia azedarach TaxID=155640 RepID=A0ACC1Y2E3_MELAZ|nr:putative Leucine-rich receptor-like kinase family protein [Melia azedarach]
MGLSSCFFTFTHFLLSLLLFHSALAHFASSNKPLCHEDERSMLLQFKESLMINENSSSLFWDVPCRPKSESWMSEEEDVECCSWDGVQCNEKTGHVTKLDLSNSCLYGIINSSNRLFHLVHLKWLNLAYNDFNFSEIPSAIKNLSELSYLNLSGSSFSGKISSSLGNLTKLVHLVLSINKLSDTLPATIGNLNSLEVLDLSTNNFSSELPSSIGDLNFIDVLDLSWNGFSGELPATIGNLSSLKQLSLSGCAFWGKLPLSLGNLTQLHSLALPFNNFAGEYRATGRFECFPLQLLRSNSIITQ